jgi:hypothetical protein
MINIVNWCNILQLDFWMRILILVLLTLWAVNVKVAEGGGK